MTMADTPTTESGAPPLPEAEPPQTKSKSGMEELATIAGDVQRTVLQSTDSALRSARSFQENSSTHLRSLQEFIPQLKSQYQAYEDDFLKKAKDEMTSAREHPAVASGVAVVAAFLLLRGPRRFLFRQTLGRFQREEARFVKAEKNVKELSLSVDLMKKESKKLLERASLAEKEMKQGCAELNCICRSAGNQIHRLAKSVNKVEAQATSLMDYLREVPGREALKLRAEVASVASILREQRMEMNKRIMKISDYGVSV